MLGIIGIQLSPKFQWEKIGEHNKKCEHLAIACQGRGYGSDIIVAKNEVLWEPKLNLRPHRWLKIPF